MKVRIFILGIGIAIGYVIGARAGREHYNQMKDKATEVWHSPKVAQARTNVEDYARNQAPLLRDKAEAFAKAAPAFVSDTAKVVSENTREFAESARRTAVELAANAKESVKENATKELAELRERGENAIDRAFSTAGKARDEALAILEDEDDIEDDVEENDLPAQS